MSSTDLGISNVKIHEFCRKWKIIRLAVFGSAVRGKLRPDSDIDLLVTFSPDAEWSMFDHYRMEEDLVKLLGREVDLINIKAIEENPNLFIRREVLDSAREIYAA